VSATSPAREAPRGAAASLLPLQRLRRAGTATGPTATAAAPAVVPGPRPLERPVLRGWLHAAAVPVVLVVGALLLARADGGAQVRSVVVFAGASALLFATSALYHRLRWTPAALLRMKRLDHGNIPLAVAAGATPLLALGLPGGDGAALLAVLWTAAGLVAVSRWLWPSCPRPLHTTGTALVGWAVVPALPAVVAHGQPVAAALVVVAGVLVTAGGAVYATRWPEPSPRWFGHHEVFHALTVVAWPVHAAAVWLLCG
jgi:hemolysin III